MRWNVGDEMCGDKTSVQKSVSRNNLDPDSPPSSAVISGPSTLQEHQPRVVFEEFLTADEGKDTAVSYSILFRYPEHNTNTTVRLIEEKTIQGRLYRFWVKRSI